MPCVYTVCSSYRRCFPPTLFGFCSIIYMPLLTAPTDRSVLYSEYMDNVRHLNSSSSNILKRAFSTGRNLATHAGRMFIIYRCCSLSLFPPHTCPTAYARLHPSRHSAHRAHRPAYEDPRIYALGDLLDVGAVYTGALLRRRVRAIRRKVRSPRSPGRVTRTRIVRSRH